MELEPAFVGHRADLPAAPDQCARDVRSANGALVTPAFIDCHTHLVFAGDRAGEFEQRLQGASYEDIARNGGGIVSTVRATRAGDEEALLVASLPRTAFAPGNVIGVITADGNRGALRIDDMSGTQLRITFVLYQN